VILPGHVARAQHTIGNRRDRLPPARASFTIASAPLGKAIARNQRQAHSRSSQNQGVSLQRDTSSWAPTLQGPLLPFETVSPQGQCLVGVSDYQRFGWTKPRRVEGCSGTAPASPRSGPAAIRQVPPTLPDVRPCRVCERCGLWPRRRDVGDVAARPRSGRCRPVARRSPASRCRASHNRAEPTVCPELAKQSA